MNLRSFWRDFLVIVLSMFAAYSVPLGLLWLTLGGR